MKQLLIIFLFSFLMINQSSAQYGVNASYQTFSASNWEGLIQDSDLLGAAPIKSGFAVGIDRWFRLKNARVEFFPELNVPSLGLGLGVDIGLSDLLTITPMIRFRRYFGAEWENLVENLNLEEPSQLSFDAQETGIETFSFGIRLGIRMGK